VSESRQLTGWWASHRVHVAAGLAFTGFAVVLTAIESLAVRGQLDFALFKLHLTQQYKMAVPIALEASGLTFAGLSLWATLTRDRAPVSRTLTVVCVLAAAVASWTGSRAAGLPTIGSDYLAAASVVALLMWHEILHRLRRDELRASGRLTTAAPPPPARPRFGASRWLVSPSETLRAWMLGVREGVTSAADAVALVRAEKSIAPPPPVGDGEGLADIAAMSKRQAIEAAAAELGTYEAVRVCEFLADRHSLAVDHSYAAKVLRLSAAARRRDLVHAVGGAR
jgi:hypothetical protein